MRASARRVYGEDPLGYETGRPEQPEALGGVERRPQLVHHRVQPTAERAAR